MANDFAKLFVLFALICVLTNYASHVYIQP